MPTENKPAEPQFNLNTPDGGRGYIARLFETVLRRHDYRQYISERLAGDFACTLALHFEDIKAREASLQQRLTVQDQRVDELDELLESALFRLECFIEAEREMPIPSMEVLRDAIQRHRAALRPTEQPAPEMQNDDDWHMNPCHKGHGDVGAAGGVASCYVCGEKIIAATTQEAFELWNASHPQQ